MTKVRPATFGELWKGFFSDNKNPPMNRNPLPQDAPIVGPPPRATADLLRQARQKILKGQDRKKVRSQLLASAARKAAVVVAPPLPPDPASPAAASFGGAGYTGRSASLLGNASNPGTVSALPRRPKQL